MCFSFLLQMRLYHVSPFDFPSIQYNYYITIMINDALYLLVYQRVLKLRDWSLITGSYKMEKSWVQTFLCPPPPQDGVKLFAPALLKSGNFLCPSSIWLKLQATT